MSCHPAFQVTDALQILLYSSPSFPADGELYTGTMNNFMGNEPIILRSLGTRPSLKTDASLGWLHCKIYVVNVKGPSNPEGWGERKGLTVLPPHSPSLSLAAGASFAGSFHIQAPDSASRVYFFFEETGKEFDFFDKVTVSRVARVCKVIIHTAYSKMAGESQRTGRKSWRPSMEATYPRRGTYSLLLFQDDVGGDKVLQKKWTTFLKAQLVCNHMDNFPFNVIRHVALLSPDDPQNAVFYGVFSSQW